MHVHVYIIKHRAQHPQYHWRVEGGGLAKGSCPPPPRFASYWRNYILHGLTSPWNDKIQNNYAAVQRRTHIFSRGKPWYWSFSIVLQQPGATIFCGTRSSTKKKWEWSCSTLVVRICQPSNIQNMLKSLIHEVQRSNLHPILFRSNS